MVELLGLAVVLLRRFGVVLVVVWMLMAPISRKRFRGAGRFTTVNITSLKRFCRNSGFRGEKLREWSFLRRNEDCPIFLCEQFQEDSSTKIVGRGLRFSRYRMSFGISGSGNANALGTTSAVARLLYRTKGKRARNRSAVICCVRRCRDRSM